MHRIRLPRIAKTTALLLSLALLAACGGQVAEPPQPTPQVQAVVNDGDYVLTPEDVDAPPQGGGALIAAVFNAAGPEGSDTNAAVWHGVETFAQSFGYTAKAYAAAADDAAAMQDAFTAAVNEQPGLIVCAGDDMAVTLHGVQELYPAVNFLLLGAEPHSEDYSDYTIAGNVHSVLFRVEQEAWLAGYGAVMDGNTSLAVAAAGAMPDSVRSTTGFIQGAEAAARRQGVQVVCRTWYNAAGRSAEDVAAYVGDWYDSGVQAVFALNSTVLQGCLQAAQERQGVWAIASGVDQSARDGAILTTAARCYSTAVQNKLYEYYAAGGTWGADAAGQSVRLGILENAVALPTANWRFTGFTVDDYAARCAELRDNIETVEIISDTTSLPATTNVAVWAEN